ncbi:mfs multidrug transporter [Moniliophthora roreri MCA 2997]|uniref:Mfs multidrug transporter n=1 Tax=Moniliophthora roreri (strain MCA 2997) TaxID=1381753 RepID=V2WZX2_MONRO|nr:mfs multidrug transporter [Moniliophthora roreri MCA 2997]
MSDERSPLLTKHSDVQNHGSITSSENLDREAERQENGEAGRIIKSPNLLLVVAPMSIGIFLAAMDQTIVLASYASIGSELKQLQKTSWIATGYMLTLTSFQPLYGKLSDIFGRKPCLLVAYCIFGLGCLLCGFSTTMNQLILSRALAGVGGGGMSTVVSIIMSDIVPLRSRGTWQGIINIVFATGSSVGAPLGGLLADSIGWRWSFFIQCPAIAIAFCSVSLALDLAPPETSDFKAKIKRVDFGGALSLVLTIFFFLYGLERGGNISWNDNYTIGALVASAVLFLVFGVIEIKLAKEPFAPKRIIFNRGLIASYLVNFFGIASQMAMVFHVSLYLQAVRSMSPSQAGLWLVPSIFGGVSGSLVGGLVIQATGRYYWVTVAGYFLQTMGLMEVTLSAGVLFTSVISLAIGGGITTSLIALISNAGPEDQAIATAVSYLFRSLGSVVGLSIGSTILQDSLRNTLRRELTGQDVNEIVRRVRESLKYLDELDSQTKTVVKGSYESSIHITMWFSIGLAICAFSSSLFIREKLIATRT